MPGGDCGDNTRMRVVLIAAVLLAVAACGQPQSPAKQAEALAAVANEGALLAHGAADESTTGPFTKTHARALREEADGVRSAIEDAELGALAQRIAGELERLAEQPGDAELAAEVARALEEAAAAAEERAR